MDFSFGEIGHGSFGAYWIGRHFSAFKLSACRGSAFIFILFIKKNLLALIVSFSLYILWKVYKLWKKRSIFLTNKINTRRESSASMSITFASMGYTFASMNITHASMGYTFNHHLLDIIYVVKYTLCCSQQDTEPNWILVQLIELSCIKVVKQGDSNNPPIYTLINITEKLTGIKSDLSTFPLPEEDSMWRVTPREIGGVVETTFVVNNTPPLW